MGITQLIEDESMRKNTRRPWEWAKSNYGSGGRERNEHFPENDRPGSSNAEANVPSLPKTILVVDDEGIVRKVMTRVLARSGYRVLEAVNAAHALRLLRMYKDHINLLLTDVVMPGLNGRELAERAVLLHPEMAVLYTSAYSADVISCKGILHPGISFIEKSFTPDSLVSKVREVLDNTSR